MPVSRCTRCLLRPAPTAARTRSSRSRVRSFNFAQFLGHAKDQRGQFGPVAFGARTLIVADEGSMFSTTDLLDIERLARARDSKIVLLGDTQQLSAVEHGGGMRLIAGQQGYAHLAEPVRFKAQWEREASVRLRQGDASVATLSAARVTVHSSFSYGLRSGCQLAPGRASGRRRDPG
jgi:ATP-dependent exoDNAse (exonuclease V) alpha subunit